MERSENDPGKEQKDKGAEPEPGSDADKARLQKFPHLRKILLPVEESEQRQKRGGEAGPWDNCETLDLGIYSEGGVCGCGKTDQDPVHDVGAEADRNPADRGRNPDIGNFSDDPQTEPFFREELSEKQVVPADVEQDRECRRDRLPDDRGVSCACASERGKPQETEDQHRVQKKIHAETRDLADHHIPGHAGCLKKAFEGDLGRGQEGEIQAGTEIGQTESDHGFICCDSFEVGRNAPDPEGREAEHQQDLQGESADDCPLRAVRVVLAERFGCDRVHTGRDASEKSRHESLYDGGERHGGQNLFPQTGKIDAVYDVIQALHEHGKDHRPCQTEQHPVWGQILYVVNALSVSQVPSSRGHFPASLFTGRTALYRNRTVLPAPSESTI